MWLSAAAAAVAVLGSTGPRSAARGGEPVDVDVCVYGATPAGIIAAVTAAREGASVAVVEPTRWIGGMVTGGLTSSDIGRPDTIGGYTREFFVRAAARYEGKHLWYAEPHANLETFRTMLAEAKVRVATGARLAGVDRQGARITGFSTLDGTKYAARMFVDATYEGDLMARAGVKYRVGREARSEYDEPLAGYHPMPIRPRSPETMASVCSCLGDTGPHYIHGTPLEIPAYDDAGRPLFGVRRHDAAPGSADGLTQSYNFRVVVTQRDDLKVPFPKPKHYDPARYELLLRLVRAYPVVRFGRLVHLGQVANGKFDLNAQGLCSTDYAGGNFDYPDGDYAARDRIWQDHVDYVQGYLWFLGHDERVPVALREETNSWGLCRDEFVDNDFWPYALYVREGRRMIGEAVMTQRDCQLEVIKPDTVGMGSFVLDSHIVERIVDSRGNVIDEGSFVDAPTRPYQIGYRSLTPKAGECENLLVPVCLSASHIAYCSLRMEPVYMALGQASGLAATLASKAGVPVQRVDVADLQRRLREQKCVLNLPGLEKMTLARDLPGIVADDADAQLAGAWQASGFGAPIQGSAQHDMNEGKGAKTAKFVIPVPAAGKYEARFAYVPGSNRARRTPITVQSADGETTTYVDERAPPPVDSRFISLGVFRFEPGKPAVITVSNAETDGYVSIDAAQLIRRD